MRRREFLLSGSASFAFTLLAPKVFAQTRAAGWRADRTLVLIELAGGNDGLNTVVPYSDPAYYQLRPAIAIKREAVVQLDEKLGLHPSLAALAETWKAGELAIVQGVGYANPNRSHFRSIDIWDTASGSSRYVTEGWVSRVIGGSRREAQRLADAVVRGGGTGPVSGTGPRAGSDPDPPRVLGRGQGLEGSEAPPETPPPPTYAGGRLRRDQPVRFHGVSQLGIVGGAAAPTSPKVGHRASSAGAAARQSAWPTQSCSAAGPVP